MEWRVDERRCWVRLLKDHPENPLVLVVTQYALYLDVAGHPSDQPVLCAGGFLSDEKSWLDFEPAWKEALKRNGLPDVFHMTDFEREYKNHPRHWDILKDLITVISDHTLASFSNTVEMEAYRKINKKYPLEEALGKPYSISASSAARLVFHWQRAQRRSGPVLYFVEQGTFHEGDMIEGFIRDGLPAPIPVPKELAPVQAADLYAWERADYAKNRIRRPSMQYLKSKMPDLIRGVDGKWDKRDIERGVRTVQLPLRSELPEGHTFRYHSSPKRIRKRSIH